MFLNRLSTDNQERFLQLAGMLCYADGKYTNNERQMMRLYAAEVGEKVGAPIIEKVETDEARHNQEGEKYFQLAYRFRSIIEEVKDKSDMKERKMILFELMGLAHADKSFSENERKLITDAVEALEFNEDMLTRLNDRGHYFNIHEVEDMLTRYVELQKEMTRYVLE
ncbi:MAG: TerB family tellurite resistance protein [Anaerovibrio sp.]|uniref:tellurite resistance TerB family protein n=1 Tax=Anaerovibrio sp. TaxID=1872532 RepID=UPI0025D3CDEA|nr:TerB family tellurite resistance protein [Anaerovibrio sp.]MCR5175661.1 TerB family tellurite resistance protein [Anaerovibrio sp.]